MSYGKSLSRKTLVRLAFLVVASLCALLPKEANSLDYYDVRELVRNMVPDQAIINVVQQSDPFEITEDQAEELRSLGASHQLVEILVVAPLDFEEIRQLVVNKVPESSIINVLRQSKRVLITPEQADELAVLGASPELISFLTTLPPGVDPEVYARIGDGSGTILTFDDLDPNTAYGNDGITVYAEPDVYVAPPTVIYDDYGYYYDDSPFGGVIIYGDRQSPRPPPHYQRPTHNRPRPPNDRPHPPQDRPRPPSDRPRPPQDRPRPPSDRPRPPQDKPRPPSDRPRPPQDKPRPPSDRPRPPQDKPRPPVEKPRPPQDKPRPPVEKPRPPQNKPRPPIEKPRPPQEKPRPPQTKPRPPKGVQPPAQTEPAHEGDRRSKRR